MQSEHVISNYDKVRYWHQKFDAFVADHPSIPTNDIADLRLSLLREEMAEVEKAVASRDLVAIAKELADLLYVTYGMSIAYGLHIDTIFELVQQSNLSKLGEDGVPVRNDKGKILKGPNYKPAEPAIREHIQDMLALAHQPK